MTDKDMLLDYMTRFRLQCHYRLDMVPGDIKELPIFMYEAAQKSVREDMEKSLCLNKDNLMVIDKASEFFLEKLIETDHYAKTDDMIMEYIEADKFSN